MITLVTLLGVGLRIIAALTPQRFWYDEAFSAILARLPLERLLAATAADVHPPLYYLTLRGWLSTPWARALAAWLGPEAAARSLSLAASLIGLVFFRALIAGLPERERHGAWIIACVAPGLIYYAGEARMYALLSCFVLGAVLLLVAPWQQRPLWGIPVGCGAGALCLGAALTHNAGMLYCVALAGAVLLWKRENWPLVMIAGGMALMGWVLVWGETFTNQLHATQGYWIWRPNLGTAVYMFYRAVFPSNQIPEWAAVPLMLALAYVTTWALVTPWRKRAWLWLAVGVPVLAYSAAHLGTTSALLHRVLMPSLYAWCVLWAFALCRPDVWRPLRALLLTAFVGVDLLLMWQGRFNSVEPLLDAIQTQPGDVVYAVNSLSVPLVLYDAAPIYVAPDGVSDAMGSGLSRGTLAALAIPALDLAQVSFARAWLIWLHDPDGGDTERAAITDALSTYHGVQQATFAAAEASLSGELWLLSP